MIEKITIQSESGNSTGTCTYRVHVNKRLVCKFELTSSDGLAECLQRAADAVELNEWTEAVIANDAKGG